MKRLYRPEAPKFLVENAEQWGKEFAAKRAANPNGEFQWKQVDKQKVNVVLREVLLEKMTQYHCSYCDGGYILGAAADETIDHFRPKFSFPNLVYQWENLFVCCNVCQKHKLEKFDELLLKPDAEDFSTLRYFILNYESGAIDINPAASEADKSRAEATIRLLGLNTIRRQKMRLNECKKWDNSNEATRVIDEWNFRFFLEP
ncbi:MAG: TIGR02646 family protein [Candidatus Kapabacteria bacterium]|jgi:uncharacterized protein (TIGR02646 family)|nr:TIGR02646 family protein [Candidatus Kapabacteria bacterium]